MRDSGALLPTPPFVAGDLFDPTAALAAVRALVRFAPRATESVALEDAFGRVLACDVDADQDHPSHARSTMDGFAIATAGGLRRRTIVGEIRMGEPPPRAIAPHETLRIPTGGALPEGADAVVALEDVREAGGEIELAETVAAGDSVTPRGSDLRRGERALTAGRRIGAPELGVLAALGHARVAVHARPRFAVISTGDELVAPGESPGIGQVRDSNRFALAGSLAAMGVDTVHVPRVPDRPEALRSAMGQALATCDGIVLSGGSSVGERDLVPRIVRTLGEPGVLVHGIRVKPGKPTMIAAVGTTPIFGLPGNPTSALTILEAVVRPLIADCTGERDARPDTIEAIAGEPFAGREGWTWYVPARVRRNGADFVAEPLRLHSAHVGLLARATGYVVLGERHARRERGDPVTVVRFCAGGAPVGDAP